MALIFAVLISLLISSSLASLDENAEYTGHSEVVYEPQIEIEEIRYPQAVPQIVYEPKSRIEYEKVPKLTVETWNSIVEEEFPSVEYDFRTTDVPARLPRITYEYQEVNRTVRLPTICYKEINRIEYQAIPRIEYIETTQPRVIPVPIPTTQTFEVKKTEIIPKLTHEWVAHKKTWPHPTIVLGNGEHIEEQVIVTGYEEKFDECTGPNCPTPAPHASVRASDRQGRSRQLLSSFGESVDPFALAQSAKAQYKREANFYPAADQFNQDRLNSFEEGIIKLLREGKIRL